MGKNGCGSGILPLVILFNPCFIRKGGAKGHPNASAYQDQHRALAAQDKVYPLNDELEVMDNLMALDTKSNSLDDAREYIKALAPWIKDHQIEYDSDMKPVGDSGAHTPFPPFHWKCRTTTIVLS